MIDFERETVYPLKEAAGFLPRRRAGRKTHPATLFRWHSPGLRGVRLEVIRVGGSLCTSREALQRFFDRLTEADSPASGAVPQRPISAARQRELDRVDRELELRGV